MMYILYNTFSYLQALDPTMSFTNGENMRKNI